MKPDFFDDYNLDEIYNPDKSENEIGIDFIECKSRYILVFELYNGDELKKWEECEKYNDKIKYLNNLSIFEFEYATNKYHIFNGIYRPKKAIHKRIDAIIHFIETIKKRFSKTTKRVYILDIKEELRLIYAAKIANNNIKNNLQELLYKLDEALCSNKEMWDCKSIADSKKIDDMQERIKEQVYLDTASLTIENINSTISDIPQEAKDLVNIIANDDEIINKSFDITVRLDSNNSFYRWYNFLLSQITVYLVNPDSMPTMEDYLKKYDLKKDDINNITTQTTMPKALGCHYSKPKNINNKDVTICICPELIESFAESVGIDKNTAYAKVIIHEFAHAMMDEQKIVKLYNDKPCLDYINSNRATLNPIFHLVMEESVANCITLNKFHAATLDEKNTIINDVIKFIEHQPDAYKFGIKQSNAKIKVCKWRTLKDKIDNNKAEEWLRKYFFNNEPYNAEAFNDLFDTKINIDSSHEKNYYELCGQIIEIDGVDCVNLGLPSGRKWAIENLEAPLGGIPKMFAWGETTPKINGTKENYLLAKDGSMTKYNAEDGLKQLCPENDAATCILGKKWRTPTLKDFQELMECCKWQWCIWRDHHGCRVIGPNGNSIFLHAGGTSGINREYQGYYWTSSLNEPEDNYAYYCTFCEDIEGEDAASLCYDEVEERYWAFYIRPVAD